MGSQVMHDSVSLRSQTDYSSKTPIVKTPIRTLVRLKYSSGGLMSHCFYDAIDSSAIILPPQSSLGSAQNIDVLTSAPRLHGHHVLAEVTGSVWCTIKANYALHAVKLNRKQLHAQKTLYGTCVPELIISDVNFNFSWFVHNHGYCFLQVCVPLLLHHQDNMSC